MNDSNKRLKKYRKKLAQRIIFGSMSEKSISKIQIKVGDDIVMLSYDYIHRKPLKHIAIIGWLFAICSVASAYFIYNFYVHADVVSQLGMLIIATAFMILYVGVTKWMCELTIKDSDIIIKSKLVV